MEKSPMRVACAVVVQDGLVLAVRRAPGQRLAGKWEFPGGKIEAGETAQGCVRRELFEELGLTVEPLAQLAVSRSEHEGSPFELLPFVCSATGEPVLTCHDRLLWASLPELEGLDWAPADVPVLASLAGFLEGSP